MTYKYTEDTVRGRIVEWINDIIKEEKLPFDRADAQIEIDRRYPDIVLWRKRPSEAVLLIELKRPIYDPWDVADEAHSKAWRAGIRFFATWNLRKFFWWDTKRSGDRYDQLCGSFDVVDIRDLSEIDRANVEASIKSFLRNFLKELSEIYFERKPAPLLPLDERFIVRLRSAIDAFSIPVFEYVKQLWEKPRDPSFREKLRLWFVEQGFSFQGTDDDFERIARQYVYLLIDKIIFYNALRLKHTRLPKIDVSDVRNGEELRQRLQIFFNAGLSIDYETIFAADFLDNIPLPDELVEPLKRFIDEISRYDLSQLGYEILGRIFERLIPDLERHKLGQYYTRSDVVDLIVGFCVRKADDTVFDPACGAGTFLIRAYERKRFLNPLKDHEKLLKELWGNDIAKFACHLTTINLASKDLSVEKNYPNVLCRDFFDLKPEKIMTLLPYEVRGLDKTRFQVQIPLFDAVVMNPPYTRQEEMEGLVFPEDYKTRLQELVKKEWGFDIGKRSSIYAYFFVHGAKFVKQGGRLGLITSNSWLDVDYGKYLQEFFLKNFKIIAIIESKVERWFEDADINTCITILERCDKKDERDNNVVKFVQLKKPLNEFIPITKSEKERWEAVERLVNFIEKINEYYEDDKIRIFPKKQEELWKEGFDEETGKYEGSKWGKYIRAPDIFFKILEKGKNLFVPLGEVATIRRGFTTGANEFFYLTEEEIKRWGIEREFWMHPVKYDEWLKIKDLIPKKDVWIDKNGEYFKQSQYAERYKLNDVLIDGNVIWIPNYVIKSPRECESIIVDPKNLKYRVLIIHKDKKELKGTNVLKYIEWGEEQGFHKRPTCASRQRWYELNEVRGKLLCMMSLNDRHVFWLNNINAFIDARLYGISLKENYSNKENLLLAILNSSLTALFVELWGRVNLGQGALDVKVYEYGKMPIIDPTIITETQLVKINTILNAISKRKIGSIFEELNAKDQNEVSLDRIDPNRKVLDTIIMQEILGLSEEEQLEVYKAVIDLVGARLKRAESVPKRGKKVKGIDVDALVESLLKEVDVNRLKRFPDDYIGVCELKEITVPKGEAEVGGDLLGFYVRVGDKEIRCKSRLEAKYIQYAIMNGHRVIKIPLDDRVVEKAVKEYESVLEEFKKRINDLLEVAIPDSKVRAEINDIVWRRIWEKLRKDLFRT